MVLWGTDNLKSEGGPIAPGAGADGRAAALRQLRPPRRRRAGAAGRARPPAHRRRHHAVGHLPRPAAAAGQAARRGRLPRRRAPTSPPSRTSSASTRWPSRPSTAATWRPRRCASSATPRAPTAPTSTSLVDNGRWDDEDELAETYTRRKGFAYGRAGRPVQQPALLKSVLAGVELAYQNLDSVELGVTTIDTYFDTLGGISRAIKRAKGPDAASRAGLHRRPDARQPAAATCAR